MTTNDRNAFITASPDSMATRGEPPPKAGSVAAIQHQLVRGNPYAFTSDDVLFEVTPV